MPLHRALKIAFVHIPRTGGTTVEKMLGLYEPWPTVRMDLLRGPYQRDGEQLHLQHLPLEDMSAIAQVDLSQWYKFAFVRNPWDRLVSVFCFMNRGNRDCGLERFRSFVSWAATVIAKRDHLVGDYCHLRPQVEFSINELDYLGRFENLEADLRKIFSHVGLPIDEIPHEHQTKRKRYVDYYDSETEQQVADLYADDIESLGYRFGD